MEIYSTGIKGKGGDAFPNSFKCIERVSDGSSPNELNQTTSFAEYIRLSCTGLEAGDYKVEWFYVWSLNSVNDDFIARVELDDTTELAQQHIEEPRDASGTGVVLNNTTGGTNNSGTNQRYYQSAFAVITLAAGNHTFDLDFTSSVGSQEAAIYRAMICVERVG